MNSTALSTNISGTNTSNSAPNAVDFDSISLVSLIPAWTKYCIVAFIGISSLIGIPGNGLVSTILLKQVRKTTTDWFIIFIAIFDTLSLVVSGTSTILVITPGVWDVVRSTVLCRFHIYMSHFFFIQSLYLITAIGFDRYVKTCNPYSIVYTPKSAFRSSLVAIVVSAACSIPFYFTTHLNKDGDCVIDRSKATLRFAANSVVLLCVLVSSVALITWYTKVALQIRKRIHFNPRAASMRSKEGTDFPTGQLTAETELPSSALSCDPGKSEASIAKAIKVLGCSQEQLNEIGKENIPEANDGKTSTVGKGKPTAALESIDIVAIENKHPAEIGRKDTAVVEKMHKVAIENKLTDAIGRVHIVAIEGRHTVADGSKPTTAIGSKHTSAIGNKPREIRIHCEDDNKVNSKERVQRQTTSDVFSIKKKQASKTTKIMAYMTLAYILSTTMPTVAISLITVFGGLKSSEVGRVVIFTMMRMYLINNFINPIFYITLSSVFRRRVAEVLNTCRR